MLELLAYIDNGQVTNGFADDDVYEEIKEAVLEKQQKGAVITMCTFAQEMKQEGRKEGREEGREEGIRNTIDAYSEFNLSDDEIAKRVSEKFNIPEDTIKEKYLKDK